MALPEHDVPFEELRELRDLALVESHYRGKRRSVGKISIGTVIACWDGENGGNTYLVDTGLRLGEKSPNIMLRSLAATTLYVCDPDTVEEAGGMVAGVTQFGMCLDPNYGSIDVYRNLRSAKRSDSVMVALSRRGERGLGFAIPSAEDLALLHTEMERGASGAYTPREIA